MPYRYEDTPAFLKPAYVFVRIATWQGAPTVFVNLADVLRHPTAFDLDTCEVLMCGDVGAAYALAEHLTPRAVGAK